MGKDTRLVNIYIKIHNKRNLTIEDLQYLSKYDPECFEKTCKNVVYNVPDAREILQPEKGGLPGSGNGMPQEEGALSGGINGMQQERGMQGSSGYGVPRQRGEISQNQGTAQRGEDSGSQNQGQADKDFFAPEPPDKEQMEQALSNLKQMEQEGLPVGEMDVDTVKNLLGNLYMEMLFPHNGRAKFFSMEDQEYLSVFNKKV